MGRHQLTQVTAVWALIFLCQSEDSILASCATPLWLQCNRQSRCFARVPATMCWNSCVLKRQPHFLFLHVAKENRHARPNCAWFCFFVQRLAKCARSFRLTSSS